MTFISAKTNFTSGQISNKLFGRGDLNIYENGARCLENVIINPTGGVSRRNGLRYVDKISGDAKLIPFEFNSEQEYLICLLNYKMNIYKNDICIAEIETPWGIEHHAKLNWTQSADTLLVVHPDVEPRIITRNIDDVWKIDKWEYYKDDTGFVFCPYFNFYNKKIKMEIILSSGIAVGLKCDEDIFNEDYLDVKIKINEGLFQIISVEDAKNVKVKVLKKHKTATTTDVWEEQSFSKLRGWPCCITFHQDRLVIGGSKSLPNRIWLSKTSDLFNFDIGTGLDDESIEMAILSDQVNAICNVVSARHLLVFTTGSEWLLGDDVLTPTSIQLSRQTNIGSYNKYSIAPEQINGATAFISYNGRQLSEFLYTDVEQAYLSKNLCLLSDGMLKSPVCSAFCKNDNVLYIILEDGSMSCLTSYRVEEVNAWCKMRTKGDFKSIAIIGDDAYFVVKRNSQFFLEKFDEEIFLDCGKTLISDTAKNVWDGFDDFEEKDISVVSNGFYLGKYKVEGGKIQLLENVTIIDAGLPFEHIIEPLPYMIDSLKPFSPKGVKSISSTFRIIDSKYFCADVGRGYLDVPLKRIFKNKILDAPAQIYSGDIELRSVKWVRDLDSLLWSIKSDVPLPFNLLSVVMKLKVNS